MKIAIMGFGTVGSGAYDILSAAEGIEVKRIFSRKLRDEYSHLADIFTDSAKDIIEDNEIDLVIESMGGVDPAKDIVLECLNHGKHVVTPNKNLISAHYEELTKCAAQNGVELRYTAAVGGGIPWLFNLMRTKRCDDINEISGIVNGTCNYILYNMHKNSSSFADVLKDAQDLGYAERDPSSDIEGTDTLRKCVISANIAFDACIDEAEVPCYGIDTVDACDIKYLGERGYCCKLMMSAKKDGDKISAYVEPCLVKSAALEANVNANFNMISLNAEHLGKFALYGQGAGKYPTGHSVAEDVIDIRDVVKMKHEKRSTKAALDGSSALCSEDAELTLDNSKVTHRYYIRHYFMCEHIEPFIESFEEKDGIFYCISKPMRLIEMHDIGRRRKELGKPLFFARIED